MYNVGMVAALVAALLFASGIETAETTQGGVVMGLSCLISFAAFTVALIAKFSPQTGTPKES